MCTRFDVTFKVWEEDINISTCFLLVVMVMAWQCAQPWRDGAMYAVVRGRGSCASHWYCQWSPGPLTQEKLGTKKIKGDILEKIQFDSTIKPNRLTKWVGAGPPPRAATVWTTWGWAGCARWGRSGGGSATTWTASSHTARWKCNISQMVSIQIF